MRVTGGTHRSRTLEAPSGEATRPTSDRVREAMFSMLMAQGVFYGEPPPVVLDLYAGSGALGIEALSRGASRAVFVEKSRAALASITKNLQALGLREASTTMPMDVTRALSVLSETFDLVLIDPPYDLVDLPAFSDVLLQAARCVSTRGWLLLEHRSSTEPPCPPSLICARQRRYGDTTISLFSHRNEERPSIV